MHQHRAHGTWHVGVVVTCPSHPSGLCVAPYVYIYNELRLWSRKDLFGSLWVLQTKLRLQYKVKEDAFPPIGLDSYLSGPTVA
jgi:hypothetical protein